MPAFKTDVNSQLIDLAMKFGVVERKGAWYIYEDVRVQGLDNFVDEVVSSGVIKDIEAQLDEQLCDTSH